jgi:hypothetical protein
MKKKVIIAMLVIGGVISALKIEAMYYQKQMQQLEADKMNLLIENKIRYADVDVCEAKLQKLTKN